MSSSEELKPCPCGAACNTEEGPYPTNHARDLWRLDCVEPDCGWSIVAESSEEALKDWNRRGASALEAENARLERSVSHWQGLAVTNRKVADDALARLAEVRGREAVGKVVAISGFRQAAVLLDAYQTASAGQSLVGSKLYALPPDSPDVEGLVKALAKTVASLDQLLPYLGKIPADVGLLNDALVAARPLLEQNTNKEVTPDGK